MKKRLIGLIAFFVIIFGVFIIVFLIPKNYFINYVINDLNIKESFDKVNNTYSFEINSFKVELESNFIHKQKLIDNANTQNGCLYLASKDLDIPIVCEDGYIKLNEEKKEKIDTYENIEIYDYNDSSYMIWNYNKFILLNNSKINTIDVFNKDHYQLDNIYQINGSLFLPNLDNEVNFEKYYLINGISGKIEEKVLEKKIYINSYILGSVGNDIYVFDATSEKEYKLNPFKNKITEINYQIYNNGVFETISLNKLLKKLYYFEYDNKYSFELDNNTLYYKSLTKKYKLLDNVSKIIKSDKKSAYVLIDDSIYYVDLFSYYKLLRYSEWKFNNKNIYVFNQK